MEALLITSVVAIALIALLLTGIILIQQSKGGGFGVAFGGLGESVFGAHAASHLIKMTVTLMIVFFVLVLFVGLLASRGSKSNMGDKFAQKMAASADTALVVTPDTAKTL